jgi:hypothetical protein
MVWLQLLFFASTTLAAATPTLAAATPTCTFQSNFDIGYSDDVIAVTRGTFTPAQCCAQCYANAMCSVAALLDNTHGKNEGCWLKTGQGEGRAKAGVTTCQSGRGPIPQPTPVNLTLLTLSDHPQATCMDGSPGGFYYAKASTNESSTSWVIELEGGGECASQKLCDSRKGTALYSSNYFKPSLHLGAFNSDDPKNNPKLRTFNRVFIPYCSQDLWTGQRTTANSDTYGYYFSGHLILQAVLDHLDTTTSLKQATNIILTGESAGGIGVWPNVDWLQQRYSGSRTVAAPIAGFYFFAHPYEGPGHTASGLADFRKSAWPQHYKLWNSFVDASCAQAMDPSYCILANNSFPFIDAEAFITEAQTDKVVLLYHDWVPDQDPKWSDPVKDYFHEWHNNMTIALQPSMDSTSKNGVFNPACFIHCSFTPTSPIIQGQNYLQAFQQWFFKEGGDSSGVKLQDHCGELCNPSCPH